MTIQVSIVIPVSRFDAVKACLDSLEKQRVANNSFEVILVSAQDLSSLKKYPVSFKLTLITDKRNHPSILRNLGVSASKGTFLGFLDDDTVVPSNWVGDVNRVLSENPERIIGGQNVDNRSEFLCAMANAVQEHPLLEGLKNHRQELPDNFRVNAHNLPLSNAAMARKTFDQIGGFNEVANYYMDGSEFLYIAKKLGIPIFIYKSLKIQHDNRPMFWPYFRYKWRSRWMLGGNYVLFPECYESALQIRAVFFSLIFFPLLLISFHLFGILALGSGALFAAYMVAIYLFAPRKFEHPLIFLLTGPCVFVAHLSMYFGFLTGWLRGLYLKSQNLHVIEHKKSRYSAFNKAI